MNDKVRLGISMSRADYDELKALARADGSTVSGYLRKAVATHAYIRERAHRGGKVFVEQGGTQTEVVFR